MALLRSNTLPPACLDFPAADAAAAKSKNEVSKEICHRFVTTAWTLDTRFWVSTCFLAGLTPRTHAPLCAFACFERAYDSVRMSCKRKANCRTIPRTQNSPKATSSCQQSFQAGKGLKVYGSLLQGRATSPDLRFRIPSDNPDSGMANDTRVSHTPARCDLLWDFGAWRSRSARKTYTGCP